MADTSNNSENPSTKSLYAKVWDYLSGSSGISDSSDQNTNTSKELIAVPKNEKAASANSGIFSRVKKHAWSIVKGHIPQHKLVQGDVIGNVNVIYKIELTRTTKEPYPINFTHPHKTIVGIVCQPLNEETPSPRFDITKGGLHKNYITILCSPESWGKWSCVIFLYGEGEAIVEEPEEFSHSFEESTDRITDRVTIEEVTE